MDDKRVYLDNLRVELKDVLESISNFHPTLSKPPIIDSTLATSDILHSEAHDSIRGLRALRDSVKRDLDVLEKFLAGPDSAHLPALSTNAPYLISVWNEVVNAPPPVLAVWATFSEDGLPLHPRRRGHPREVGVKVDVVADGGKRWIRVNTTKNSRLLAEFREIDSYLTDSDSDDGHGAEDTSRPAQFTLDNSVIRMGRSLLGTANANPLPGTTQAPSVTLRLTRLNPEPADTGEYDPRIAQTIEELRDMGIDVQLGEQFCSHSHQADIVPPTTSFRPSRCINLDLSILIALVSDLTHAPLPASAEDAEARFTPCTPHIPGKVQHTRCVRDEGDIKPAEEATSDPLRPSRAVIAQAVQEMKRGLIDDVHERVGLLETSTNSDSPVDMQFWTTPEARDRCLQIVSKIGGPDEKARANALFAPGPETTLRQAEETYWRHSRYSKCHIPLLPVHIFPSGNPEPGTSSLSRAEDETTLSPFFRSLTKTCREILAQDTMQDPRSTDIGDDEETTEIKRATVTKAIPRLTAHTVQSMLWGAVSGWTTLTANRTSVKIILREIKAARNGAYWNQGDEHHLLEAAADSNLNLESREHVDIAALWTTDPRSLAEGMRTDLDIRAR